VIPRSRWGRLAAVALVLVGFAIIAVVQTAHQRPGTDFHARWLAGQWFRTGQSLYQYLPGEREPSYPPFATMVFQVFSWFPLRVAAAGFYFINLLLIPAAVILTRRIFRRLWPDPLASPWPLVWAFVLALQFFLNNLNLVQVNEALLVLCLWGVDAHLAGRDVEAAGTLVAAAFIKIIPAAFVAWLLLRGRPRARLAVFGFSLGCLALPMVQRGVPAGVEDLRTYYETFLGGFAGGVPAEYDRYTNQALGPAVHRLMRPPVAAGEWDYRVIPASEPVALDVYRALSLVIGLAVLIYLVLLRHRAAPVTVFEISALFLGEHLLSGITWHAHLVSLAFVYYGFLLRSPARMTTGRRAYRWVAIGLMAVTGLLGRDIAGNTIHHWIGGYSLVTWLMLYLLVGCLVRSWPSLRPRALAPAAT